MALLLSTSSVHLSYRRSEVPTRKKEPMPTITPNPKPRKDLGFASLAHYLEVNLKGTDHEKREHDGHYGEGRIVKFFTGVKAPQGELAIRRMGNGRWKISILRPAGRGGIATGTSEVQRVYLCDSPDDLYSYVDNFDSRSPKALEVEAV